MNKMQSIAVAALFGITISGLSSNVFAQDEAGSRTEVSLSGGFHVLNRNDTALPDRFVNVPLVATVGQRLTRSLALEGEFTWLIPVKQDVTLGTTTQQRETPDILAYQANVRANLPVATAWSPYLAAGAGAVTVLSNTDADRVPRLDTSQTMFALNFGTGANYSLNSRWGLRGDFRELVAFPSDKATGLSNASGADPIWMERVTVGASYAF